MKARLPVHPAWGLAEVALLWLVYSFGLWVLGPRVGDGGTILVAYWLIVIVAFIHVFGASPILLHADPPNLRGWSYIPQRRTDPGALSLAWPAYAAFTLAAGAAMVASALVADPDALARVQWDRVALKFSGYLIFGPLQALIFFGFAQTRLRVAIPCGPGGEGRHRLLVSAATAAIFGLVHVPNGPLVAITMAGGLVWAFIFYRRPNILLLGVSHAVLGTILHEVVQLNMRIGPFYADGRGYILRAVIPGLEDWFGGTF